MSFNSTGAHRVVRWPGGNRAGNGSTQPAQRAYLRTLTSWRPATGEGSYGPLTLFAFWRVAPSSGRPEMHWMAARPPRSARGR